MDLSLLLKLGFIQNLLYSSENRFTYIRPMYFVKDNCYVTIFIAFFKEQHSLLKSAIFEAGPFSDRSQLCWSVGSPLQNNFINTEHLLQTSSLTPSITFRNHQYFLLACSIYRQSNLFSSMHNSSHSLTARCCCRRPRTS